MPDPDGLPTMSTHLLHHVAEKVFFFPPPGVVRFTIVPSNAQGMPAGAASLSSDRLPEHVLPFDRIVRAGHDQYSIRDSNLEVNPP